MSIIKLLASETIPERLQGTVEGDIQLDHV